MHSLSLLFVSSLAAIARCDPVAEPMVTAPAVLFPRQINVIDDLDDLNSLVRTHCSASSAAAMSCVTDTNKIPACATSLLTAIFNDDTDEDDRASDACECSYYATISDCYRSHCPSNAVAESYLTSYSRDVCTAAVTTTTTNGSGTSGTSTPTTGSGSGGGAGSETTGSNAPASTSPDSAGVALRPGSSFGSSEMAIWTAWVGLSVGTFVAMLI